MPQGLGTSAHQEQPNQHAFPIMLAGNEVMIGQQVISPLPLEMLISELLSDWLHSGTMDGWERGRLFIRPRAVNPGRHAWFATDGCVLFSHLGAFVVVQAPLARISLESPFSTGHLLKALFPTCVGFSISAHVSTLMFTFLPWLCLV